MNCAGGRYNSEKTTSSAALSVKRSIKVLHYNWQPYAFLSAQLLVVVNYDQRQTANWWSQDARRRSTVHAASPYLDHQHGTLPPSIREPSLTVMQFRNRLNYIEKHTLCLNNIRTLIIIIIIIVIILIKKTICAYTNFQFGCISWYAQCQDSYWRLPSEPIFNFVFNPRDLYYQRYKKK